MKSKCVYCAQYVSQHAGVALATPSPSECVELRDKLRARAGAGFIIENDCPRFRPDGEAYLRWVARHGE